MAYAVGDSLKKYILFVVVGSGNKVLLLLIFSLYNMMLSFSYVCILVMKLFGDILSLLCFFSSISRTLRLCHNLIMRPCPASNKNYRFKTSVTCYHFMCHPRQPPQPQALPRPSKCPKVYTTMNSGEKNYAKKSVNFIKTKIVTNSCNF